MAPRGGQRARRGAARGTEPRAAPARALHRGAPARHRQDRPGALPRCRRISAPGHRTRRRRRVEPRRRDRGARRQPRRARRPDCDALDAARLAGHRRPLPPHARRRATTSSATASIWPTSPPSALARASCSTEASSCPIPARSIASASRRPQWDTVCSGAAGRVPVDPGAVRVGLTEGQRWRGCRVAGGHVCRLPASAPLHLFTPAPRTRVFDSRKSVKIAADQLASVAPDPHTDTRNVGHCQEFVSASARWSCARGTRPIPPPCRCHDGSIRRRRPSSRSTTSVRGFVKRA